MAATATACKTRDFIQRLLEVLAAFSASHVTCLLPLNVLLYSHTHTYSHTLSHTLSRTLQLNTLLNSLAPWLTPTQYD
jgi:hypothetical protein